MSLTGYGYLGPYRLLNIVNVGQTSRLWQAYDDTAREYVGIKTLQDHILKDKSQITYLQWEYSVGEKLIHPRIVRVKGFGWDKKIPYLAMEWFFAPDLKQWINRGYMSYAANMKGIFEMMLEALVYFHDQGWVHHDIKPDNFLYLDSPNQTNPEDENESIPETDGESEPFQVKMIDFALAKKKVSGIGKLFAFKSKTIQGTASYMSPEQILRKPTDGRSDIYSLGCSFFELLTGKLPFTGNSMNDLLQKHISGATPSIASRNRNLTPEVADLIKVMLNKAPDSRPKSALDILSALRGMRMFKRNPSDADIM